MKGLEKTDVAAFHSLVMDSSMTTVVTHTHPDGDAIGSSVAMSSFMRSKGKDICIIFPDPVPDNLRFMLGEELCMTFCASPETCAKRLSESDLLICLDFNSFDRASEAETELRKSKADKVLIDHHIGPDRNNFGLVFSECGISSASEMLFYLLREAFVGEKFPLETSEALLTGMTTDTNNFANSVYPSTLKMASILLDEGVDRNRILDKLNNQYRENRLRAMGWLLKDEMTLTADGVAYMILTDEILRQYDLRDGESEGFVNLPLALAQVRMSILLKYDTDHYRVSIRSKEGTSANQIAKNSFNGGGHENAAGGKLLCPKDIPSMKREDAALYIEKVTGEFFK